MATMVAANGLYLHAQIEGPDDAPVILFANSLGTDFRVWDPVLRHLPDDFRILRYDMRGHGLSDCPPPPYAMADLVADARAVMAAFDVDDVVFVGLSIGGLVGQGLASENPDMVRGLVLMDTAAQIATPEIWRVRMEMVERAGVDGVADAVLERWFSPSFRADPARLAPWASMLRRTPAEGYLGCSAAIAGANYAASTRALTLPVMAMAGAFDGSTPPDVVRATAELCGGTFHLIEEAGHIPGVEQPEEVAQLILDFVRGL